PLHPTPTLRRNRRRPRQSPRPHPHTPGTGKNMITETYDEYKDSGVDWIGSVPAHWSLNPIRSVVEERRVKNPDGNEAFYLSLVSGRGIVPYSEKGDIGNKMPENLSRCKVVEEGDLVINSMNYGIGSYGISSYKGVCSSVYIVLRPRASVDVSFIKRIFEVQGFQKLAQSFGNGILEHRSAISWETLRTLRVPVPTLTEQRSIADFLDRETAEIDAFIADQEQLIALLEERRIATITHAVTKGLDPNAPMKDSGIEWLGDIPEHWETRRIKFFVSTPVTDGPHETPEILSTGIPFVSAEAVSSGTLNFEKIRGYISKEDNLRFSMKYMPQLHDIYMIKSGATTGVCAIVDTDIQFNIWSPLAAIRCNDNTSPRFILHALRSRNFQESVRLFWNY